MGPLFTGENQTRNKFRIDAGGRTGILNEPEWKLIASEYPETPRNFMVFAMEEREMLAEKIIALATWNKGRDLYDVWFLLNAGVKISGELVEKKSGRQNISAEIKTMEFISNREYERDMKRLTSG